MATVLVHGGAHGAWCWERLAPHLEGPALAIDLPGRGTRPLPLAEVTVDLWADAVAEEISKLPAARVTLVGHSLAGMVLPRVAERVPHSLLRLIFVSCSVPPEGQSVLDIVTPEVKALAEENQRRALPQRLPEPVARKMFCTDMDEEQTRFVLDRLVPEAWGPLLEPSQLAGLQRGIPASYVKLLADEVVPPALQDQMIANIANVGPVEVEEFDAGHDAMISRPAELAALINRICAASQ